MNGYQIFFYGIGALLIGGGFAALWVSRSGVKRPKTKGKHREFYTKGEVITAWIKGKPVH